MATTIYKETSYVIWNSKNAVLPVGFGGGMNQPIGGGGLDGGGVANEVAFWLDNNTLVSDEGLKYEVDSSGIGTLKVSYIKALDRTDTDSDAVSSGDTISGPGNPLYISGGDAISDGISDFAGGDVYIQAGLPSNNGSSGNVYISPGWNENTFSCGNIILGGPNVYGGSIIVSAEASGGNTELFIEASGGVFISTTSFNSYISIINQELVLVSPVIEVGHYTLNGSGIIQPLTQSGAIGSHLTLKGGNVIGSGIQNWDGGNIYIFGGSPFGTGLRGDVYFGDGSNGYLKAKTSETNVVYYDPATGKLSYGTGGGSGGVSLSGSTNNTICTVTGADAIQGESNLTFDGTTLTNSAGDMYANNFVLNSDERLKTNIEFYKPEFLDIDYKQFVMKSNFDQIRYGVIAQDLQKKYPELVREEVSGMLAVSYFDLLIREISYLKSKVKELENR